MVKGIDVSHYQGAIDWAKVRAAGFEFAFIKATQGTAYSKVDYFRNNAPVALGSGLEVGAYHYGTFSNVPEAIAEARYFLSVVKDFRLTYPLVLDLEENKQGVSKQQLTDAAIAFLEVIENAGYFAVLYTGKNFLETQLDESRLKPYALWVARYNSELGRSADIWQYTSSGKVDGISGNVDMNISYRDFATEIRGIHPAAAPKKKYVALPASDPTWRVYPLNKIAKVGNEVGLLAPKRFGGLTYEILKDRGNYVFEIQTDSFGRVQIYAAPSTGAKVIEK